MREKTNFSLVFARAMNGRSISEVAREACVTRQQLHRYLNGGALPRADSFLRLCKTLRINPWDFNADGVEVAHPVVPTDQTPSQHDIPDGIFAVYAASAQRAGKAVRYYVIISTSQLTGHREFWVRHPRWLYRYITNRVENRVGSGAIWKVGANLVLSARSKGNRAGEIELSIRALKKRTELDAWFGLHTVIEGGTVPIMALRTVFVPTTETSYARAFAKSKILEFRECPTNVRTFFEFPNSHTASLVGQF